MTYCLPLKICQLASLWLLAIAAPAISQAPDRNVGSIEHLPALKGDYFSLFSKEVGRNYHIYVRLPEGYDDNPDQRYPVVYLLDGDSTFPMLAPLHLFMHYDDQIPEAILVGIAYGGFEPGVNMRHIDFRTVMDDGTPGGAPQFLSMLENELLPRIDDKFRADSTRRIIVGQSRGGSAVLQAAWLKPGLFWGHVASNPGREPDTKLLFGMDRAPPEKKRSGHLIVASGSRDRDYLRGTALEWRDTVAARDDFPWDTSFIDIPGGTHAADLGNVYRAAMKTMFAQTTESKTEPQN
ncbi:MAG: alpha/beta hydrolase-fold protein [Parasphingorhabdus sp.]|uniref:alpha/beta hydrolase n=1 Tax=Parasphingorhabdus sp. TaxID=2709688 RepID=UPI00300273A1